MKRNTMRQQLEDNGFCVFPEVLKQEELEQVRAALDRGVDMTRQHLGSTHVSFMDPNEANVRVNLLPAVDPIFIELLLREDALASVAAAIGNHYIISNFTANIALPGSGSMNLHSDQALVVPPPWTHPWAMNVIWCLDDVSEANGVTRYLPGSHRFRSFDELPQDAMEQTLPFEAPAGSFIAMEGRLWHTSGKNTTRDQQRRMMFAYYSADFIRPQINWAMALPQAVQSGMDEQARRLFGLTPMGNTRIGTAMVTLPQAQ